MILKACSKDYRAISFLRAIFTYDLFDDDDEAMEGEGNKKYVMDILLNIQSSFEFGRSDIPFITPIVIHPHISHQMPFKDIFTLSHLLFNLQDVFVAVTLWFHIFCVCSRRRRIKLVKVKNHDSTYIVTHVITNHWDDNAKVLEVIYRCDHKKLLNQKMAKKFSYL